MNFSLSLPVTKGSRRQKDRDLVTARQPRVTAALGRHVNRGGRGGGDPLTPPLSLNPLFFHAICTALQRGQNSDVNWIKHWFIQRN